MAYTPRVTMPSSHHKEDAEFISSCLLALTPAHQLKARVAYSEAYLEAFNGEQTEHKKSNAGRKAANTRLRIFKDKCLEIYASKPREIRQAVEATQEFEW